MSSPLRRTLEKPPRVVWQRALGEARVELDRIRGPLRERRLVVDDDTWDYALARPYPFVRSPDELAKIERRWPDERERVIAAAERAARREVDVLGTGPVQLGDPIDWQQDWKSGRVWPLRYGRRLDVADLGRPSDVKIPWEISRAQWLLPAGQAYALTGDERFAAAARDVLTDWLARNPYGRGVNWAIAMEAAFRVFSWTFLLHSCGRSRAWDDAGFRRRLLRGLHLHVEFVARNLERSDVNGNHLVADAAALVVGGSVLGLTEPAEEGWRVLTAELPRQVSADGVDFEMSASYHRLVAELFAVAAFFRREVPDSYLARLQEMAKFTHSYTAPDGRAPLWGDADDARVLPLGGQDVADHRSLPAIVAALTGRTAPGNAESAWIAGPECVGCEASAASAAFPAGGIVVLRDGADHVFVDCGPVGLGGRGGHGHNDCLSFEASLGGRRLITDCGSFVYTASAEWRDRFRSTAFHNTSQIDGAEQNRFDGMWRLKNDAVPEVRSVGADHVTASHSGFRRLVDPVTPVRTIRLEGGKLAIRDEFEGTGEHLVEIPLHLDPAISVERDGAVIMLLGDDDAYRLTWRAEDDWTLALGTGWVAPRYGVKVETVRLVWSRRGTLRPLLVEVEAVAR